MAVHAFVMRADPSCTRRKAVVSRHNSIYTPDNTIAIVCNRVVGRADKGNSYHNGVVRHHNAVVIVCNRVVRRADEGNSYNKRVVTHHNTIVIACNRICTLAGKEKTIVDGGAGGVGEPVRAVCSSQPTTPASSPGSRACGSRTGWRRVAGPGRVSPRCPQTQKAAFLRLFACCGSALRQAATSSLSV